MKFLTFLMVFALILMIPLAYMTNPRNTQVRTNFPVEQEELPQVTEGLTPNDLELKVFPAEKTIVLEVSNTIILQGPVTQESTAMVIRQLFVLSHRLPKTTPIYLVLDTPGGSISAGLDLIDYAKAIPQKVHTISLVAASMGFQIAQNLNTRYVARNGILMSHRAYTEGIGGQIKGELETRYARLRRMIDLLDFTAATRMKMSLKDYEALILHEYWVQGQDAVTQNAADQLVLLSCGKSMIGTRNVEFSTFIGSVTVTFDQCPLMKAPLNMDLSKVSSNDANKKQELFQIFIMAFENKIRFFKKYIKTGDFDRIFY